MKPITLEENYPNVDFTRQELNILKLASEGLSNKEIGSKLCIEENTTKRHRQNIMRKVGIKGKSAMMKLLISLEM
ncbi:DNA-binding NarL/FixJ family response regulator [Arcicella rosea]|uniref:helix-turn-helix transcriptional regulator n=1 Tax=Arcicella rosea TaxID=502909 RepID=UPI00345D5D80